MPWPRASLAASRCSITSARWTPRPRAPGRATPPGRAPRGRSASTRRARRRAPRRARPRPRHRGASRTPPRSADRSPAWRSRHRSTPSHSSPGRLVLLEDLEADPGALQALDQRVAHGHGRGHLAGRLGEVVLGQAERGLRQHLGRVAVAGVSARDLRDDAAPPALALEADLEPALLDLLLRRPLARLAPGEEEVADGRDLG